MYKLQPGQAQYNHFDLIWSLWPWPSTCLKMFQMALLLFEDNNCAKLFWNPCINVQVMARTNSIYDHSDINLTPVTLTFNLPETMFQMALLLLKDNFAKVFWNPRINVQVMARTNPIHVFDHFDLYLIPVTLTFILLKNVSNGTFPLREQQLCKIILKSMPKCTSYGPDKLNTCVWPIWPLLDPCDLDFQPT